MTETVLLAPLVAADVDLRGFEFMPLFGDRLFKSATWIGASAEAKVAALRLWWHSYGHEVPASSLPDDDNLLSDYAGYGVMVREWRKVKAQAMRGYVLCSDGRWYHPIVAELAMDGWKERVRNREKQRAWRERNQKKDGDVTVTDGVTKPLRNAGQGEDSERTVNGQGQVNLKTTSGGDLPVVTPDEPSPPDEPATTPKGSRLAKNWKLPKAWGEWALKERPGWSKDKVLKVAEKFRDHWIAQPGQKGVKAEWDAMWRNWVRNEGDSHTEAETAKPKAAPSCVCCGETGSWSIGRDWYCSKHDQHSERAVA